MATLSLAITLGTAPLMVELSMVKWVLYAKHT